MQLFKMLYILTTSGHLSLCHYIIKSIKVIISSSLIVGVSSRWWNKNWTSQNGFSWWIEWFFSDITKKLIKFYQGERVLVLRGQVACLLFERSRRISDAQNTGFKIRVVSEWLGIRIAIEIDEGNTNYRR